MKVTIHVPTEIESIGQRTARALQLLIDTAGESKLPQLLELVERDEARFEMLFRMILKAL